MDEIVFCQPVTNKTVSIVRDRYSQLGWGEVCLLGSGSNVTQLRFKWCGNGQPEFPKVSDLGLAAPHRL